MLEDGQGAEEIKNQRDFENFNSLLYNFFI